MPHKPGPSKRAYYRAYYLANKDRVDHERRKKETRARNRARTRVAKAHPLEYQRYLVEERAKEGIGYRRKRHIKP